MKFYLKDTKKCVSPLAHYDCEKVKMLFEIQKKENENEKKKKQMEKQVRKLCRMCFLLSVLREIIKSQSCQT